MPYQGLENYHYVEDVGEHFAACAMQNFDGYGEFNIKGKTIPVEEFLQTVRTQAAELGYGEYVDISIAADAKPNMFSYDLSHDRIDTTFDRLPRTEISEGIRKSLITFSRIAGEGNLIL
jgi:hypothetical protein